MIITLNRKEAEYELNIEYTWEDRRMGLLNFHINEVTHVGTEEDIDPTLFEESLNDEEMAEIESQIRDGDK